MAELEREQEFDLRVYIQILVRRKWLILGFTGALTAIVGVGTALQPKVYAAKVSILAGREAPRLLNFDPLPQERFYERNYLKTQAAILTSLSVLQQTAKSLIAEGFYGTIPPNQLEARSLDIAHGIQGRVKVESSDDNQVMRLGVEGGVPDRVARIANAVAEEYVRRSLEQKQDMASQAVDWLQARMDEARKNLSTAESELQAFRDKEKITVSDDADPYSTLALTRLNDDYMTTRLQRIERESRLEALRKAQRARASGNAPNASLDLEVQRVLRESLTKEYVDAQLALKNLSQRYGPEHPDIITLKGKADKVQKELQALDAPVEPGAPGEAVPTGNIADLQLEYNQLVSREKALAQALEGHKAEARNLSRTAVSYAILKQKVDLNRQTYNDLLARWNDIRLSGEIKNTSVQILDRAEAPKYPIEPQPVRNLLVAMPLGLVLGIGLALLLETLDRRVKNPQDVARFLKLPLLTVVPGIGLGKGVGRAEGKAQLVTIQQPRSHAAECYRNLRTSILFSSGRPVPGTILVTSAVAGEGKSTTASNLAVVMAQSGRRVLLIDADLRRPALQRYFPRQEGRGLVRVLKDGVRPEDAIQASGIENLDLLLCHAVPPNPSELLGSPRLPGLMEMLRSRYETIIIDSPVVISVPDAVILAARAEAVIMVHCPEAADRDMVRYAREKLEEVKANILGLVMNKVDVKSNKYFYSGYLYYGYGTEPDTPADQGKVRKRKS